MSDLKDDGASFGALMGAFGTHADPARRARAEKIASLKPSDKRRKKLAKPARSQQFNIRTTKQTIEMIDALKARNGWNNADAIEAAVAALYASQIGGGA